MRTHVNIHHDCFSSKFLKCISYRIIIIKDNVIFCSFAIHNIHFHPKTFPLYKKPCPFYGNLILLDNKIKMTSDVPF